MDLGWDVCETRKITASDRIHHFKTMQDYLDAKEGRDLKEHIYLPSVSYIDDEGLAIFDDMPFFNSDFNNDFFLRCMLNIL